MVCLLCDFKILLTVFNQSYNCQTSPYLGRNRLPKLFLILPSLLYRIEINQHFMFLTFAETTYQCITIFIWGRRRKIKVLSWILSLQLNVLFLLISLLLLLSSAAKTSLFYGFLGWTAVVQFGFPAGFLWAWSSHEQA